MSSRPLLRPQVVANALSMTTADTYSLYTNINMIPVFGYTVSWTNGASGNFTVEICNDYSPPSPDKQGVLNTQADTGTWVALTISPSVSTSGTAGTAYIDIVGTSAAWVRMHFHNTASTGGTWTAEIAGKVM